MGKRARTHNAKRCIIQKANLLLDKSGVSRGLNGMARVGVSADGIENGY
jgi:hypothetical protein